MKHFEPDVLSAVKRKPVLEMLCEDFRAEIEAETDGGRRAVLESVLVGLGAALHNPRMVDVTIQDAAECRNRFMPYRPTGADQAEYAAWAATVSAVGK